MNIKEKLKEAINMSVTEKGKRNSYVFLPEIIETLKAIENSISDGDIDKCRTLSGGLGRLVTEDYAFSESNIGTILLSIVSEFE